MPLDMWVLHFYRFFPRVENFGKFLYKTVSELLLAPFKYSPEEMLLFEPYIHVLNVRSGDEVVSNVLDQTSPRKVAELVDTHEGDMGEAVGDLLRQRQDLEKIIKDSAVRDFGKIQEENERLKRQDILAKETAKRKRSSREHSRRQIRDWEAVHGEKEKELAASREATAALERKNKTLIVSSLVVGSVASIVLFIAEWLPLSDVALKIANSGPVVIGGLVALFGHLFYTPKISTELKKQGDIQGRLDEAAENIREFNESIRETED